ncbi:MAG: CDGSH iron-sulfur domain-containing protein [Thermoguttaceae bacterium]|nr:CDGSH iron-sulfur domain-containing protein [Thermoguttaceae bacterium]
MAEVTIKVNYNGPYLVQGPVRIVDRDGREFPVNAEKPVALCRCGQSTKRPFCDGTHRSCGFIGEDLAPAPPA